MMSTKTSQNGPMINDAEPIGAGLERGRKLHGMAERQLREPHNCHPEYDPAAGS